MDDGFEKEYGRNPLLKGDMIGVDLTFSFSWEIDENYEDVSTPPNSFDYEEEFYNMLKDSLAPKFSDAFDGYLYINSITLYDNSEHFGEEDVYQIYHYSDWPSDKYLGFVCNSSMIEKEKKKGNLCGGYPERFGANQVSAFGDEYTFKYLEKPEDFAKGGPDNDLYVSTILHELGHLWFEFFEEYNDRYRHERDNELKSLMSWWYNRDYFEYSSPYDYYEMRDRPPTPSYDWSDFQTEQSWKRKESCWPAIYRKNKDQVNFDLDLDGNVDIFEDLNDNIDSTEEQPPGDWKKLLTIIDNTRE